MYRLRESPLNRILIKISNVLSRPYHSSLKFLFPWHHQTIKNSYLFVYNVYRLRESPLNRILIKISNVLSRPYHSSLTITHPVLHLVLQLKKNWWDLNLNDICDLVSEYPIILHMWWGKSANKSVVSVLVHKMSWVMTVDEIVDDDQKYWVSWNFSEVKFDDISVNIWSLDTFEVSTLGYWTSRAQCAEN